MTFISEAHNRLLARLAKAAPVEISMFPTAEELDAQAAHVKDVGSLLIDYLHSLAVDGAHSTSSKTINAHDLSFVSDGMADFAGQFTEAAEQLREDEEAPRSDFAEHSTLNHAQQGIAR